MDRVEEDLKRMKIVGWRAKVEDRQEWNRIVKQTETHQRLYSQQKKKKKKKTKIKCILIKFAKKITYLAASRYKCYLYTEGRAVYGKAHILRYAVNRTMLVYLLYANIRFQFSCSDMHKHYSRFFCFFFRKKNCSYTESQHHLIIRHSYNNIRMSLLSVINGLSCAARQSYRVRCISTLTE